MKKENPFLIGKWYIYDIIGISLSLVTIIINFIQIHEMINKKTNEGMSLLWLIFTTMTLCAWSVYHALLGSYATSLMTIIVTLQFIGMIFIKIWKNRKEKIIKSFERKKITYKIESI